MKKLVVALLFIAVLAILAGTTLDGKMRLAVWVFLAGLAVRTIIHLKAQE